MPDVEQLMLNAQLRTELEPYYDEAVEAVDMSSMTTADENDYLASILAWETAPALPIAHWFDPQLDPPNPVKLCDQRLREHLHQLLGRLAEKNVVLDCTEHLSDRELYCVILRDILPARIKLVDNPKAVTHWRCVDPITDEQTWLSLYADDEERKLWSISRGEDPPHRCPAPHPRVLPRRAH